MNGNSIQKLQVIDPAVLKSLLEQLNANMKRQTVANIVDESGMNELMHDYNKFLAQSKKSSLKDSLRQNLYSRIQQYKRNKRTVGSGNTASETQTENEPAGQQNDDDDDLSPHASRLSAKFHARSVQQFEKRLGSKGIRSSNDEFLIGPNGKKKQYSLRRCFK